MSSSLAPLLAERGPIRSVGVVGMGYVGIPAAVLFAHSPGMERVLGFQRDSPSSGFKIGMLNRGESPLKGEEPELESLIAEAVRSGRFACTPDFSRVGECDAVTLAIQTPFADPSDLLPDFGPLFDGIRKVGEHLERGMLVVLESTVTPGTTVGPARELLEEASGLRAGTDFALAHAPERVMVGRLVRNIREHDRIVGGIDPPSTERAAELYRHVLTTGRIIPMTATAAEVTKTAENTLRDLQIAAVNQLALYCEAMGVNVYDVRDGVDSLKGEGITRAVLWPGAGVGGHCLTKDTYHLERGAHTLGKDILDFPDDLMSLYVVARRINEFMPSHMARLTSDGLARTGRRLDGARIALLGWAFIGNSDDARNPPAEPFRDLVIASGAEVRVHDPHVHSYPGVPISRDLDGVFEGADAVVIFTSHDEYRSLDPVRTRHLSGHEHPVIVDGRNMVDPDAFIGVGWIYKGIGRGDRNEHPVAWLDRRTS
ncbi:MAG: nucleotide sugar dehydrogenase [Methanospirillum sp.]|nr:nucleotide sugar dehydrogenase [Methanospirillum sp.]